MWNGNKQMPVIYNCRKSSSASLSLVVCQDFSSKLSHSRKFIHCPKISLIEHFCKYYLLAKAGMSFKKDLTFGPYLQFKVVIFKSFLSFWSELINTFFCLIDNEHHSEGQLNQQLIQWNLNLKNLKSLTGRDFPGRKYLLCFWAR